MNHPLSSQLQTALFVTLLAVPGVQCAQAQGRDVASDEIVLRVREIEGIGRRGLVQTPVYSTSLRRSTATLGEWARIRITFDSSPTWIDEVGVQFYALLARKENGKSKYMLCRNSDVYVDVPRGKKHKGAVYIRPNSLRRWGQVVAVAAVVQANGRLQAEVSDADSDSIKKSGKWWENTKIETKEGVLLRRSATPFAFVNVDDYGFSRP